MDDWFETLEARSELPADGAFELQHRGFVVLPGPVPAEQMERLTNAYDAAISSASGADLRVGSTSTRVSDFVNRGTEFDGLYVFPPLLDACCRVIGRPFKLSSLLARTLRPGSPAQELHVDVRRDSADWPLLGFILMVDEFRPDNGACQPAQPVVGRGGHPRSRPTRWQVQAWGPADSFIFMDRPGTARSELVGRRGARFRAFFLATAGNRLAASLQPGPGCVSAGTRWQRIAVWSSWGIERQGAAPTACTRVQRTHVGFGFSLAADALPSGPEAMTMAVEPRYDLLLLPRPVISIGAWRFLRFPLRRCGGFSGCATRRGPGPVLGMLMLVSGALLLTIGFGIRNRKRWARPLILAFWLLEGALNVLAYVRGGQARLLWAPFLLFSGWYLYRKQNVVGYFARSWEA
jgi:hypothetical protein